MKNVASFFEDRGALHGPQRGSGKEERRTLVVGEQGEDPVDEVLQQQRIDEMIGDG